MSSQTGTRLKAAYEAAEQIKARLHIPLHKLTIADVSTHTGLALRDAESGLHYLVSEYRGHLSTTSKGELLFDFPTAFTKPWESRERLTELWQKTKRAALGVAKFVVRAWISIVLVGYVAIFAAILIALAFAQKSDERESRGSSFGSTLLLHTLLRVILDSLFWTFHPFSPFRASYYDDPYAPRRREPTIPFYQKVNNFFFGPEKAPEDKSENTRRILASIRANEGRIGIFDVMRVTGLSKEAADPLMARLMLDYDGEVHVSPEGALSYHFTELRKSTMQRGEEEPKPVWYKRSILPAFTGNPTGSNFLIASLNGFNLLMSFVAIQAGWTLEQLQYLFTAGAYQAKYGYLPPAPADGLPLVLGYVPFIFSLFLFMLPVLRFSRRSGERLKIDRENGYKGILRAIVSSVSPSGIPEDTLRRAWQEMAKREPTDKELIADIVKLGGAIETDANGNTRYHFPELEAETRALSKERLVASKTERDVGQVVFSSAQ